SSLRLRPPPRSTPFPYTTLFRSRRRRTACRRQLASERESPGVMGSRRRADTGRTLGAARRRPPRQPREGSAATKLPVISVSPFRSEEHTSELQPLVNLLCRLLLG